MDKTHKLMEELLVPWRIVPTDECFQVVDRNKDVVATVRTERIARVIAAAPSLYLTCRQIESSGDLRGDVEELTDFLDDIMDEKL